MKNNYILGVLLAALCVCSNASADGYYGVSYAHTNIDFGFSQERKVGNLVGKLGQSITENIAMEVRLGFGVKDDDEIKIESLVGSYVRIGMEVDNFSPHLLLGYTNVSLDSRFGSEDDSDVSYGVGIDFGLSDDWDLNVEYMKYFDKDDVSFDTLSLGFSIDY